jgi:hypothetical protein
MITPKVERAKPARDAKCRLCNKIIKKGEDSIVFRDVHVSPHIRDLYFHEDCLKEALKVLG